MLRTPAPLKGALDFTIMPRHSRAHFYKFATAETAAKVIESKAFRWSSPEKFNDPFDHHVGFTMDIAPETFAAFLLSSIERIVFSDTEPVAPGESVFAALTQRFRPIRHRLPKDEFLADMRDACIESARRLTSQFGIFNKEIYRHLIHSRVFCVCEELDNVVMWSHYADEHRGVAFQLGCIPELDNPLLIAQQVTYSESLVPFPDPNAYAKHLTGEAPIDLMPLVWQVAFTKHKNWAYEKEWRIHLPLIREAVGDGYSIEREHPQVFQSLYLGCRMANAEATRIASLVKQHLPQMSIYQARKSSSRFGLEFEQL